MRRKELMKAAAIMVCLTITLTGCNTQNTNTATTQSVESTTSSTTNTGTGSSTQANSSEVESTIVIDEFSDKDLDDTYDESTATKIDLSSESGTVEITAEGTYILTGSLNGQVVVNSDGSDIKLVLDNATITCDNSAAIYVKKADKVIITLPEGTTSTLTDGTEYVYDDAANEEPNAAIFSKADLTINGTGSLIVNANFNNGIRSNDTLKLVNGNITVNAVANAITGKDGVIVADGTYTINAGNHGIKATNDSDETLGYLVIYGGVFDITSVEDGLHAVNDMIISDGYITIDAGDDGMHSDGNLIIEGGNIDIQNSYEGLEGSNVYINGGDISVNATDDGINSAGGSDSMDTERSGRDSFMGGSDTHVYINGGTVYVDAAGDGIDSNGYIYVNGGSVIVNGPTDNNNAAIDYQSGLEITGGVMFAIGSSGMAGVPTATDNQSYIMANVNGMEGSVVTIYDGNENVLYEYTAKKGFSNIIFSSYDVTEGQTYYITINDGEKTEVTAGTSSGFGNFGGGGFGGGGRQNGGSFDGMGENGEFGGKGNMGERPDGEMPTGEIPEGMPEGVPTGEIPTGGMPQGVPQGETTTTAAAK